VKTTGRLSSPRTAEIRVLSAGAVRPALVKIIEAFRRETGHDVEVAFATAPALQKRLGGGESVDVVIAPPSLVYDLIRTGKATATDLVTVGRIGVGVMVRSGAPVPRITDVDEFKETLLNAESIVYNQASTGLYLEGLFDRLGIGAQVKAKATRYPDAAAVLDHISKGTGNDIGLGATTVIIDGKDKGIELVGPLPAEVQYYTTYVAIVLADGSIGAPAREFIRYMTTPEASAVFAAAGVEPSSL
jgi:molybdate transport system substrate-binding protein